VLPDDNSSGLADAVAYALRAEGFDVDAVADGEAALEAVRRDRYDVLVLDLMLPGVSGMEVCRRLRSDSAIPILMLTAPHGAPVG
jgi:DNA-binding response OmpR family regulator